MNSVLVTHFLLAVLVFIFSWRTCRKFHYYSIVDVLWAYFFTVSVWYYFFILGGALERKALIAVLVTFWSLRLGTHLLLRLKKHYPTEDSRYTQLKKEWGAKASWKFLLFFIAQGLSIPLLCLPLFFAMQNAENHFSFLDWTGLFLVVCGLIGEALSDAQLKNFRLEPANKGKVCEDGLWRFSRHPNYFFEWMIWCGYAVFSLASPVAFSWAGVLSPMIMFTLLYFISGIPPAEAASLKSKGKLYEEYQRTTSKFVPWMRKTKI